MAERGSLSLTTIAALATAPAPAGLAVVRVSGPQARAALTALFRARQDPTSRPREMILGEILDHHTGAVIDRALAVYMPGPHSYTGEDVSELQLHGSPLLVQKLLRSLYSFGAIPAEPGEFTKRAFLNGKLDLAQAEAIADLIEASSEHALRVAGEHLHGRFSHTIQELGEPLRDTLARIEASIDFPDEPVEAVQLETLRAAATTALHTIHGLLSTYAYGQVLREGFRVLLCGRPNVGKSSLLNLILGRPRAIVSEISGTTRDLIEENTVLAGFRFVFCDSAGLTETADKVEQIGIELAKECIPWADLVLFVVDATDVPADQIAALEYLRGRAKKIWMVVNKIDTNPKAFASFFCDSSVCAQNFYLSARTKDGFQALLDALVSEVKSHQADHADSSQVVTNERHRNCLTRAEAALTRMLDALNAAMPLEIISVELRSALGALEEIVGKTFTEDILGRVFSKFCIGK